MRCGRFSDKRVYCSHDPNANHRVNSHALNAKYQCLPNHRSALAKGVGGGPSFKEIRVFYQILERCSISPQY